MFGLLFLIGVVYYLITLDIKFYEISNDVAILSIYDPKFEKLSCVAIKKNPDIVTFNLPKVVYSLTGSNIPCITALALKN